MGIKFNSSDNELNANLPLQMALYFNVTFFPVWLIIILQLLLNMVTNYYHNNFKFSFTVVQYACYSELYKFIAVAVIFTVITIEAFRLYLGYEGNLRDKVVLQPKLWEDVIFIFFQIPELAGFWMISLLLQFPLQNLLLLNPYFNMRILETSVQSIMVLMLIVELISGYFALKYTAAQQANYFRIMKLKSDITVSSFYEKYRDL